MRNEFTATATGAVVKAAPAVSVAFWTADKLVTLATLAYVILQASYLVWKWRSEAEARKRTDDGPHADGSGT
ncbi:MAG TPA: hypothetical protein ACQGQG_10510 [Xylella sp.]